MNEALHKISSAAAKADAFTPHIRDMSNFRCELIAEEHGIRVRCVIELRSPQCETVIYANHAIISYDAIELSETLDMAVDRVRSLTIEAAGAHNWKSA